MNQLRCEELVRLVTDYMDDALDADQRRAIEQHLEVCRGCVHHVGQMRVTVKAVQGLREESLPPLTREELLAQFREWRRSEPT